MKFGLFVSFFMHLFVIVLVIFNLPSLFLPKPEIKAISVKIVQAKDVKKTNKPEQPKAVNTQQSEAPKAPPKKKEKPKPKPEPVKKAPTVVKKESKKKVQTKEVVKKEEPKKVEQKEPPKKIVEDKKPPKLDKSKDKKNVIKDKEAPKAPAPDDFMKALSFVEDLKAEQSAMFEGEDTEETTLNLAEQADIARIKKHIEKNWYRTPGTHGKEFAQIRLKVNRDGSLSSMNVVNYEGTASFINSLKRAIRRSTPLPIPTEKYETFREIDLFWENS